MDTWPCCDNTLCWKQAPAFTLTSTPDNKDADDVQVLLCVHEALRTTNFNVWMLAVRAVMWWSTVASVGHGESTSDPNVVRLGTWRWGGVGKTQ